MDLVGTWSTDFLYKPGAQSGSSVYLRADGRGALTYETGLSTEATVFSWSLSGNSLELTELGTWGEVEYGPWEREGVSGVLSRTDTSFSVAVEDTPVHGPLPVLRIPFDRRAGVPQAFARKDATIPDRISTLLDRFGAPPPGLTVSVPTPELRAALAARVDAVVWDLTGPPPAEHFDLVVQPYMAPVSRLAALDGLSVRAVQSQAIGYDGVADVLPPGIPFCNAAGVHEASTAELAVGLILASLRNFWAFARSDGEWRSGRFEALADKTVLVLGHGGVGRAVIDRLRPFEVTIVPVAARRREGVHGFESVPRLLPAADVVVLAVPLNDSTRGMVSTQFLDSMKRGALLVNVARGPVVDTVALTAAVREGRVRAALDVTDPEPLPPDHELWRLPGALITPHVGGNTTAMLPRVVRLVEAQLDRLANDEPLANVVLS